MKRCSENKGSRGAKVMRGEKKPTGGMMRGMKKARSSGR
jgi:hypothetical protein